MAGLRAVCAMFAVRSHTVVATSIQRGAGMIPEPDGPYGLLPVGCHRTTFREIAEVFVERAPFGAERARLWEVFESYAADVWRHMPSTRMWINGGFVTYKPWEAPRDVDVCLVVKPSEFDLVPEAVLDAMLTRFPAPGVRVQPMAGKVDAFAAARGSAEDQRAYRAQWSRVRGPDHNEVPGVHKGYLEVLAP